VARWSCFVRMLFPCDVERRSLAADQSLLIRLIIAVNRDLVPKQEPAAIPFPSPARRPEKVPTVSSGPDFKHNSDSRSIVRSCFSLMDKGSRCESEEIAVQEVVGAGQQQVRFVWASIGAFHVCIWTLTMTELWAWGRSELELVNRSASPWDNRARRPSHADKRRAWRRALLSDEINAVLRPGVTEAEIQAATERLLSLAA
jgi:hypothetical protein